MVRTRHSFAGATYPDLKHAFEYVETKASYVDTDRSVTLRQGDSGYMLNWIQGQDLGRKFRALHTKASSMPCPYLSSDVQHPILHEMGGPPWTETLGEWKR